jgi:hypothetical protein
MDSFQIPDYLSPITAYRTWQWDTEGLKSLNNTLWFPGQEAVAVTGMHGCPGAAADFDWKLNPMISKHSAPGAGCSCGIYAAKNFEHLANIGYLGQGIHGEVYLWGRVVDHQLGYRAQFAYPKNLTIPQDMLPYSLQEMESRLLTLTAYGVDIFIDCRQVVEGEIVYLSADIPLWSKALGGYTPEGADFLIERRKKWYAYRPEKPTLRFGDRVSVIGYGIGLVDAISLETPNTEASVRILMFNTTMITVPFKDVVWSHKNYRWETDTVGYVSHGIVCFPAS